MPTYRTPGVHIQEANAFANSVVEAPTAVAAFVGYTQRAVFDAAPRHGEPVAITSLAEFEAVFGGPPRPRLRVSALADPARADFVATLPGGPPRGYALAQIGPRFRLHDALRFFFLNGGAACWVVSVGGYDAPAIEAAALAQGLAALADQAEPTLVVIPEAVELPAAECYNLQAAMLAHCAATNRFAILDIHRGDQPRAAAAGDPVAAFRAGIGTEHLGYGSAYYPWLRTSLFDGKALSAEDFEGDDIDLLLASGGALRDAAAGRLGLMAPSAAMAGIYTMVDATRGVWKAPANVSLDGVIATAVAIDHRDQEDLNVSSDGRSVNAIRPFVGQGVLVWGARTLDGNSLDWRYISVRRTCQMVEESVRAALAPLVFEPNTAPTWTVVRSMVENYLTGLWRRGGLAGQTPKDAFAVQCGLGQTMTQADVDAGVLRMTVLLAMSRPAEFNVLTFQQQMQA